MGLSVEASAHHYRTAMYTTDVSKIFWSEINVIFDSIREIQRVSHHSKLIEPFVVFVLCNWVSICFNLSFSLCKSHLLMSVRCVFRCFRDECVQGSSVF